MRFLVYHFPHFFHFTYNSGGELCTNFFSEFDCSPFPRIMDYISLVAGASVKCAELLNKGQAKVTINLNGGWHHAHR